MLLGKLRITGHSMEPNLKENDLVLISNIVYIYKDPEINDIVAFKLNGKILVKRIIKIKDTRYFLQGDNKDDSFDSRSFGSVSKKEILGKLIYKLK